MHCQKCNEKDFPEDYKFCPFCGEDLTPDCVGEEVCSTPHEPKYGIFKCLGCSRRSLGFADNYKPLPSINTNRKEEQK